MLHPLNVDTQICSGMELTLPTPSAQDSRVTLNLCKVGRMDGERTHLIPMPCTQAH